MDTRGNLADPEVVSQITPGESTRGTVEDLLGSPTTVATFNDRTWYYIGRKTERFAFFKPEILEQQVVAIHFDEAGTVENVKIYGPDDAREVEVVDRTTPTAGQELTVLQELFGNLGDRQLRFAQGTRCPIDAHHVQNYLRRRSEPRLEQLE